MVDNHNQWHEKLPFALLGYGTIVRTSTGATPYMLVYGTEAVISAEVEIPFLIIIQEAKISDVERIRSRYEHLAITNGKTMNVPDVTQGNSNRISEAKQSKQAKAQTNLPAKLTIFLWMQAQ
uniref:Uncharacterized protein LOC104230762 n=1 Tax=Nicotiana sylvestris TaxID=4096 RepID=A0A1U7X638_NICSY|nr:PREDICTED: uncharacterized protein LOC104230762 [Nicotiana sylvestris]